MVLAACLLTITLGLVGCRHASKSTPTPVAAQGREADRFPLNLWFPQPNFAGRSIRESGLGNFKPFTIKDDIKILNTNLEDNHVDFLEHQAENKRNSESQNRKKSKLGAKKKKQSKSSLKKMSKTTALKYKIAKTPSRLKTPKRLKKNKQRKRLIRTSKLLVKHKKGSSNKRGGKIQVKQSKEVLYRQVTAACLIDIEAVYLYERNQMKNFLQQSDRVKRSLKIIEGKAAKKVNFDGPASGLLKWLGGNKNNPLCLGSTKEIAEGAENGFRTLDSCQKLIETSCSVDPAKLESFTSNFTLCEETFLNITEKITNCRLATLSETQDISTLCTCWADINADVEEIKKVKCNGVNADTLVRMDRGICIRYFQTCKQEEDLVTEYIFNCSGGALPGGSNVPSAGKCPGPYIMYKGYIVYIKQHFLS
ncbi:uncharacterized protein LOC111704852 isoform X2 [Eurytemora carolleeae]|uniref:uncharacterized protein LOC111704852 isoform X2 n=1 Tax=Eurytemora carolleeae TaxID=1294199 RepID=UPI000C76BBF6|nr:uncharacterized protein LOC111704852 isoform X2 [Eurytemora carolleeae]|eukprot:XP_023332982.1 uncharacterized protein LOC111704852 isoform X2 [Eurytemora affinis]